MKAIVMLSGGMDSAVALGLAVRHHDAVNVLAVTFDYGQRHEKEMNAAAKLAKHYNVLYKVIKIDLRQIGGSALTNETIDVPEHEEDEDVWEKTGSALTYVPMRNTIFLALCAAVAEVVGAKEIYTGFNWIDSGGYPDTRPTYVNAINVMLRYGSRDKPHVVVPLIDDTKCEIVLRGEALGTPWEKTWSCYEGKEHPCGKCNACVQRKKGFDAAGVVDPVK